MYEKNPFVNCEWIIHNSQFTKFPTQPAVNIFVLLEILKHDPQTQIRRVPLVLQEDQS